MNAPDRFSIAASILTLTLVFATVPARAGDPAFDGDTYTFDHQVGALIDGIFKCLSVHMSGMDDNTVLFDGATELLDPYLDGNQPFIFEFETPSRGPTGGTQIEINTFGQTGSDLFPEGFEDPETGTPLTDACFEIGIDDTLDGDTGDPATAVSVQQASLELFRDGNSLFGGPVDITSAFSTPWNGRLSLVGLNLAGQDIDNVRVIIDTVEDPTNIFSDGFESGNTASWTNTVGN